MATDNPSIAGAQADRAQLEVPHKLALTAAVMAAMVMQVLDTTIANVALPHMQASLGATQDSISWVLTSYILATAIMIPLSGWLAARIGPRKLFLAALALFIVASALCGLAANLSSMVAFRILQGVGGAFIAPLAQTIMLDINRPSQHARAMSVYGMAVMIGPIVGPVLGGYLTENWDWRWVFFVNVPVGVVCLTALWFLLPRQRPARRKIDLVGWALIALGIGALQLLLDRGHLIDWFNATESWVYVGISLSALWMLAIHIATARNPIFPLPMLRDRNFALGVVFMFVVGLVMMAVMALLPPMLQIIYGYPVVDTGLLLASRGVGVLLTMGIAGRLVGTVQPRLLLATGFGICAVSLWMMTGWALDMGASHIILAGFIQGMGLGFTFVPLNVITFSSLAPQYRTDASGLINLSRNVGSSVGIAIVTFMLAQNAQVSHADLVVHVTPFNLPMDPSQAQAYGALGESVLSAMDAMVLRQALMIAYLDDFYLMMLVSLAVIPLLLFIRKVKRPQGEPLPVMAE